jgi:hypothetical protein
LSRAARRSSGVWAFGRAEAEPVEFAAAAVPERFELENVCAAVELECVGELLRAAGLAPAADARSAALERGGSLLALLEPVAGDDAPPEPGAGCGDGDGDDEVLALVAGVIWTGGGTAALGFPAEADSDGGDTWPEAVEVGCG